MIKETLCCGLLLLSCNGPANKPAPEVQAADQRVDGPTEMTVAPSASNASALEFPDADSLQGAALTYQIIDAPNGTFGYEIFNKGRLFVRQTNRPGQAGVEGCRTRADAEKLAALVVEKIQAGELPPSISAEEMEGLGIR